MHKSFSPLKTNTDIKTWIESNLIEQDRVAFEKLGAKRLIFQSNYRKPIPGLYIDPPPQQAVTWKSSQGRSFTDSFFDQLAPLIQRHVCHWFFVTMPQDEYTVLQWVASAEATNCNSSKLYVFENAGAEGGAQILGLTFEDQGMLAFTLKDGFEIAHYGSDYLWAEITSALNGDDLVKKKP